MTDDPRPLKSRDLQLRQRQVAGLLLLALTVLIVALARMRLQHGSWGDLFPHGWWRW
jgi:hypothetical protein